MQLIRTAHYKRDYKKLSHSIQKRTDKKLNLLVKNLFHPSLRVKKVKKYNDVFEGTIARDYRFLFKITKDSYILLRIGKHDILEKK